LLLVIGDHGAARVGRLDVPRDDWIVWSEVMFVAAGMIWLRRRISARRRRPR
jgi:hypothetical protein